MSKRILRVNQLIQKELSKIILREIDFPPRVLVTLTRVETSLDLNEVKVYVSCLPEKESQKTLSILERETYHLQKILDKRLKMKIIPKIKFVEEFKTREAGEIEELLEKIKKKS